MNDEQSLIFYNDKNVSMMRTKQFKLQISFTPQQQI